VINILSNAVKYGRSEAPIISIASTVQNDRFILTIEDNGPGINERDQARLFEKFSRGSGASEETGAGLGLAISKRIVEHFGGTLRLLPHERRGARFEVSLPLANPQ